MTANHSRLDGSRLIEDVTEPGRIYTTSFKEASPEAATLWYYPKNCGYGPDDFGRGSGVRAWFKCPEGLDHLFQSEISLMTRAEKTSSNFLGCPFCRGFRASKTNNFARRFPHLVKEWMKTKNSVKPHEVSYGSQIKVWWKCANGHTWQAPVKTRSNGVGCRVCELGITTDLRKFPNALKEFDWTKNPGINPYALPFGKKVWWRCAEYKRHTWESGFYRTKKGIRCPYCANKKGSKENNLRKTHPHLVRQWHRTKNKELEPQSFTSGSHQKIWWKCREGSDHEWIAKIADRTNFETNCPFCANQKVSITNSISTLAPHLVAEWHKTKNGKVKPHNEMAGSSIKRWWKCLNCKNEWQTQPRYRYRRGYGCPKCAINKDS